MATPQNGILPAPRPCARFVVLKVRPPVRNKRKIAKIAANIPSITARIAKVDPRAKLSCTVSFGTSFWNAVSKKGKPRRLKTFPKITGPDKRVAPSTGGDILLHILSKRPDLNFELASTIRSEFGDAVHVLDDVIGFEYLDTRDLTGFIDGTENPTGVKNRREVGLIGDEDPAFAGGSYVFCQRYVHNLPKWNRLADKSQEKIIGRTKKKSIELSDQKKPPSSHVARVVMQENGEELEIVRHSFPYGSVDQKGLFFLAYTRDLNIPLKMLNRMLGTTGDGHHDRLTDFTQAVTGATFFAPSLPMLRSLGK
jgi:putative iron-dependent peroxidase